MRDAVFCMHLHLHTHMFTNTHAHAHSHTHSQAIQGTHAQGTSDHDHHNPKLARILHAQTTHQRTGVQHTATLGGADAFSSSSSSLSHDALLLHEACALAARHSMHNSDVCIVRKVETTCGCGGWGLCIIHTLNVTRHCYTPTTSPTTSPTIPTNPPTHSPTHNPTPNRMNGAHQHQYVQQCSQYVHMHASSHSLRVLHLCQKHVPMNHLWLQGCVWQTTW